MNTENTQGRKAITKKYFQKASMRPWGANLIYEGRFDKKLSFIIVKGFKNILFED